MMLLLPSVSSVAHLWGVQRGLTCALKVIGESREAQIELSFLLQHGVRKARPTRSGANLCEIAAHLIHSDYKEFAQYVQEPDREGLAGSCFDWLEKARLSQSDPQPEPHGQSGRRSINFEKKSGSP
ncbi:hypothetical protein [Sulfitobacter sp. LC.270.F.C4]|uniref:hypothetical protein n=1 Tax=Sulfitobacter sp. LC.270.F.C4 TaxID=3079556 RepID=UPI002941C9A9|nr:hypothetical protein [Sulfitobacter sp. LC.270.F.C4]WOI16866.1 hypothetical protein R1T45_10930 [Sulfitobacter sp. LC.270.F.C4]